MSLADELEAEYVRVSNDVDECSRMGYCSDWECYAAMRKIIEDHIKRLREGE